MPSTIYGSDHPIGTQRRKLRVGEAEETAVDRGVVLPELWSDEADPAWRAGELREHGRHRYFTEIRINRSGDVATGLDVRVGKEVGDRVDRRHRYARGVERRLRFVGGD